MFFCKASDSVTQLEKENFLSGSRIIEISKPSELKKVKRIVISHSFRIKKKIKKIWERIRSIVSVTNKKSIHSINLNIDNETITDDKVFSNHFNKFFSSITGKLVRKIQNTNKTFDSYLNNLKNPFFFHLYHQMMLKH